MKKLIAILSIAALTVSGYAQGLGLGNTTPIQLTQPISIASTTAAVVYTNGVFDVHGYAGLAAVIYSWTNTVSTVGSPTLGFSLMGGSTSDATTFTKVSLGGNATSNAAVNVTNLVTGSVGTNVTWTVPTSFTTGASNAVQGTSGFGIIYLPIADIPRYIQARWDIPTGTNTFVMSAILVGRSVQQ